MIDTFRAETSEEALGRRVHEVNRQRAVERAIDRLRHGLKADWQFLSQDDLTNLRWLMGEIWAMKSRDEWDQLHFSKLTIAETKQIVGHGDRLRRHGTQRMATIDTVCAIVCTARDRAMAEGVVFDELAPVR